MVPGVGFASLVTLPERGCWPQLARCVERSRGVIAPILRRKHTERFLYQVDRRLEASELTVVALVK